MNVSASFGYSGIKIRSPLLSYAQQSSLSLFRNEQATILLKGQSTRDWTSRHQGRRPSDSRDFSADYSGADNRYTVKTALEICDLFGVTSPSGSLLSLQYFISACDSRVTSLLKHPARWVTLALETAPLSTLIPTSPASDASLPSDHVALAPRRELKMTAAAVVSLPKCDDRLNSSCDPLAP
jgi:hypothetical protein